MRHIKTVITQTVGSVSEHLIVVVSQHFRDTVRLAKTHLDAAQIAICPGVIHRVKVGILEGVTVQCEVAQSITKHVTGLSARSVEGDGTRAHTEVSVGHNIVVHVKYLLLSLMELIANGNRGLSARRHVAHVQLDHRDIGIRRFGCSPGS